MIWIKQEGRGTLATLGVPLVFVLALATLMGCGGDALPPSPEEASNVVVRVSGAEGLAYSGNYGTIASEPRAVDSTLGDEPTDYEVEEDVSEGVTAFFRKTQPGEGELKADILADDELVVESTAYAEFGSVVLNWLPEAGVPGEGPPEEDQQQEST